MFSKIFSKLFLVGAILLLLFVQNANAQRNEQIRKLKVDFVTGQMSLTQQQTQKFLPLFNRYLDDLLVYKRALRKMEEKPDPAHQTEERKKANAKILEITDRYKGDFLKIITPQQYASMQKAEREFFKKVLSSYLEKNKK